MADNIDDDGYDDMNRAFLQAFMARASMTVEEATNVLAAIFSVNGSPPSHALFMSWVTVY